MGLKDLFKGKNADKDTVTSADLEALKPAKDKAEEKKEEVKETVTTPLQAVKPAAANVVKPGPTLKKIDVVAQEVIRGEWGNGDERKQKLEAAGYKFDEVQGRVNDILAGKATPNAINKGPTLVEAVAKEVIQGNWGNGDERKQKLEAAGFDYNQVQAKVNELMAGGAAGLKAIDEIAKEVIRGDWGNGDERKQKLEAAGYDYNAVQAKVNELLK